jgi:hypothetical protein
MERLHARNQNQFRAVLISSILGLIWILAVWGKEIRSFFTAQTADIARETLE